MSKEIPYLDVFSRSMNSTRATTLTLDDMRIHTILVEEQIGMRRRNIRREEIELLIVTTMEDNDDPGLLVQIVLLYVGGA